MMPDGSVAAGRVDDGWHRSVKSCHARISPARRISKRGTSESLTLGNEPMRMMHLSAEWARSMERKGFPIVGKGITRLGNSVSHYFGNCWGMLRLCSRGGFSMLQYRVRSRARFESSGESRALLKCVACISYSCTLLCKVGYVLGPAV
jgi:hypothetical protein